MRSLPPTARELGDVHAVTDGAEGAEVSPSGRVIGRLSLRFEHCANSMQTHLVVREQHPPLRVVRAFACADGGALVHLHNLSGGVLGGDRLGLSVEVGRRARAQLTSTGATRLYRSREDMPPAVQQSVVEVGEEALLEYLPDALIPFAGSRYRQATRIDLAAGAGLFWWEIVAPGREARGELFAYDLLQSSLAILAEGRPLALEQIRLEPRKRPLSSLARLGPYYYYASFYICRVGLAEPYWLDLERQLADLAGQLSAPGEVLWGVSTLPAHGLSVRALSRRGPPLIPGLLAFWHAAKMELYGVAAVPPRKLY